ncbi:hypothetical protein HK102_007924 [Quaeritorhiza haematococci]|nr:hypothetical protein HK102_007924 [Quaeritorhiza haematococci]
MGGDVLVEGGAGAGAETQNLDESEPLIRESLISWNVAVGEPVYGSTRYIERQTLKNRRWVTLYIVFYILDVIFIPLWYFFRMHPYYRELPDDIVGPIDREEARFLLFAAPLVGVLFALAGYRSLVPHSDSKTPPLPLSSWQAVQVRLNEAKLELIETIEWWCSHPLSLRQRAEYSLRAWVGWTVAAVFLGQSVLIIGVELVKVGRETFPWAYIPLLMFMSLPYLSILFGLWKDRELKKSPIEERGDPDDRQVLAHKLDPIKVLKRERFANVGKDLNLAWECS